MSCQSTRAMPRCTQAADGSSRRPATSFRADSLARMPRGPTVDRTPADLLRQRPGRARRQRSAPHRSPCPPRPCCPGRRWRSSNSTAASVRRSPSRGSRRRWRPLSIVQQHVAEIRQLGFLAFALPMQLLEALGARIAGGRVLRASNRRPVTSESSPAARAWAWTASKNAAATSPDSSRSRFLVNVVGCQTGFSPTNHRNSRLSLVSSRSLHRVEHATAKRAGLASTDALSWRTGSRIGATLLRASSVSVMVGRHVSGDRS